MWLTRWGRASASCMARFPPFEWPSSGAGWSVTESMTAKASRTSDSHE